MKALLSMICVFASAAVYAAGDPTAAELTQIIRSELPAGWTISYDPQHHWIKILRKDAVMMWPSGHNLSVDAPNERNTFALALRVEPFVSPRRYRALLLQNRKLQKQLSVATDAMRDISHKFDSFNPTTESERQRVEHYEQLKSAINHLPGFYFRDISLSWGYPEGGDGYKDVIDRAIRKECAKVTETAIRTLSKYP